MIKKLTKLIGLNKEDFDTYVSNGSINLSNARLIPTLKVGDEMSLTSIFLSSLRLVKEFRHKIFSQIKLPKNGKAYYFTEVEFKDKSPQRFDGLIVIVIGGKIKDAVVFEMKNKNNPVDEIQIKDYVKLCKSLGINKLVTISNEFVNHPSKSPINIKAQIFKKFNIYHFSWTYIMTIGRLLLFDNDENIDDDDQVEIMNEVIHHFDNKSSNISGYSKMNNKWKEISEKVNSKATLYMKDDDVHKTALSWNQEERNLALMLSRELGVLVKSKSATTKDNLEKNKKTLVNSYQLKSSLIVKNAVSNINITSDFLTRTISITQEINPPTNRGSVAQLTWLIKQINNCEKKSFEEYNKIKNNLWLEANIKRTSRDLKIKFDDVVELYDDIKTKEISTFKLIYVMNLGKKFTQPTSFVNILESMLLDYYKGFIQHLKNYIPPAPKIKEKVEKG